MSDKPEFEVNFSNVVVKRGSGIITPDWNQNDRNAKDYIKNRPMYTEDTITKTLIDDTFNLQNKNNLYITQIQIDLIPGKYIVEIDNTQYETSLQTYTDDNRNIKYIGDVNIMFDPTQAKLPFILLDNEYIFATTLQGDTHNIKINVYYNPVVKLPEIYMPYEYVKQSELGDYIKKGEFSTLSEYGITDGVSQSDLFDIQHIQFSKSTVKNLCDIHIKYIGDGGFSSCGYLTLVDVPSCINFGSSSFANCENLTEVYAGKITEIPEYCFYKTPNLITCVFGNLTIIGNNGFRESKVNNIVGIDSVKSIGNSGFQEAGITELNLNDLTNIANNCFYTCSKLTSFSAPNLTNLSASAFSNCSSLTNIYIPNVTKFTNSDYADVYSGQHIFRNCENLTTISMPKLNKSQAEFGYYCFSGCKRLETLDIPFKPTAFGNSTFKDCEDAPFLNTLDFSEVTKIDQNCFENCTGLTEVVADNLVTMGSNVFQGCTGLTKFVAKNLNKGASGMFLKCSKLNFVDCGNISSILNVTFKDTNLDTIILRNVDKVCAYKYSSGYDAFLNTPIASGTGYIYVPSALIDEYKTANSWNRYAAQFRALEDYTVDGTTTGDLDPNKI